MVKQSTTLGATSDFPTGLFTYTIGDASPVMEFNGQGKVTVTLDGEVIVVAAYQVSSDMFEVVDVEGAYAYPEGGIGRYQWSLNGEVLSFVLLEDNNPARRKGFAQPFTKQNGG
ncbi:MAG: hypothetical protein KA765_01310 [Thermoflexales bacterium]|nr:hypothetical protein [Thermoflexales bacterium]